MLYNSENKLTVVITGVNGYVSNAVKNYLNNFDLFSVRCISIREQDFDLPCGDILVHIAGVTHGFSEDYYNVNFAKTVLLCEKVKKHSYKKIIYLSSMSLYDSPKQRSSKIGIDLNTPVCPSSDYAKSKWLAEEYIKSTSKISYSILRVPPLYCKNKTDYFKGYKAPIRNLKIFPLFPKVGKKGLLHIESLCEIIRQEILDFENSKIVLPQDFDTPTPNDIYRKAANFYNGKTSYVLGLLVCFARKLSGKNSNEKINMYYCGDGLVSCDRHSWKEVF